MWGLIPLGPNKDNRSVIVYSSSYQVIVHRVKSWTDEIPESYKQGLLGYEKAREVNQEFYIAAEFSSPSIHSSLTFEIGDGKLKAMEITKTLLWSNQTSTTFTLEQ